MTEKQFYSPLPPRAALPESLLGQLFGHHFQISGTRVGLIFYIVLKGSCWIAWLCIDFDLEFDLAYAHVWNLHMAELGRTDNMNADLGQTPSSHGGFREDQQYLGQT